MMVEYLPISMVVAKLATEVMKTAEAAKDVAFEKESFKVLSKHLSGMEPVLKELQLKKLDESPVARQALEFLEADVKKASNLVEKYRNGSRFYLLVRCRHIVNEVQDVTRNIGRSLKTLSAANIEVLLGISDQMNKLHNDMQRAEFETSQSRLQIIDRLNQGLSDQRLDPNDILKDIAEAVGVPVDPSEIRKELQSLEREKYEAANRKERAEAFFLEQVIDLLSRADAARNYEEVKKQYFQRLQVIEGHDPRVEYIAPFKAFTCCITGSVMVDPVSLCTGTACEREALQNWFDRGNKTDPQTGDLLEDISFRPNLKLRQSIQEWKELNYCLKIRSCKLKLLSAIDSFVEEAFVEVLGQMQELIRENSINKYWISIGGLTEIIISILGSIENEVAKREILVTLKIIIEGNVRNKYLLVENQSFKDVIVCLGCNSSISEGAIQLLYVLFLERSCWDVYFKKLYQQNSVIFHLVTIIKNSVSDSSEKATEILMKLCDEDDQNIIRAAEAGWYKPLTRSMIEGLESSRIVMLRALAGFELTDEKAKQLGEEGLIPLLLEMSSGKFESKELSLAVLSKLSIYHDIKRHIAQAGGVPLVLKLLSLEMRTILTSKCFEILENLSSDGDGIKFFVDGNGDQLELEPVSTNLLSFLDSEQNPNASDAVRKPAVHALLHICQSNAELVKMAVLKANGVSLVLTLLDDSDSKIREAAINLLFLFSQNEAQEVVEFLFEPRRVEALVRFLKNDENSDVQMAAAGVLANLPKSETSLTEKLIEFDGLKAIVDILRSGTIETKENALSALFRFTDPTNLESQKIVVELGAYPLLVDCLKESSLTAKARAAALIGDLSMRSLQLSVVPKGAGCWCLPGTRPQSCPAHGGICSVNKSFCLLEANALPDLVRLLQDKVHETAYEAIQTLSTLVDEENPHKGAKVLHVNNAIVQILEVLTWGSESLKDEVLGLLEKVFMSKEMVIIYRWTAKAPLIRLTERGIHDDGHLQRKAARVLLLIEKNSRSSTSSSIVANGVTQN